MRVLVCGDRNWTAEEAMRDRLDELYVKHHGELVIIEGGARGADAFAHRWAIDHDVTYEEYPARWDKFGRSAGPIRNRQMLTEGKPDLVLAFHPNIAESKGTKDMIAAAQKAGVPVELYTS